MPATFRLGRNAGINCSMDSQEDKRRRHAERQVNGDVDSVILPFAAASASRRLAKDLLVDRLRNDNPAVAGRCVSEWADPLDAAILAALLLDRPALELDRRARAAGAAGREAEAAFWRRAGDLFIAITSETPAGGEA